MIFMLSFSLIEFFIFPSHPLMLAFIFTSLNLLNVNNLDCSSIFGMVVGQIMLLNIDAGLIRNRLPGSQFLVMVLLRLKR